MRGGVRVGLVVLVEAFYFPALSWFFWIVVWFLIWVLVNTTLGSWIAGLLMCLWLLVAVSVVVQCCSLVDNKYFVGLVLEVQSLPSPFVLQMAFPPCPTDWRMSIRVVGVGWKRKKREEQGDDDVDEAEDECGSWKSSECAHWLCGGPVWLHIVFSSNLWQHLEPAGPLNPGECGYCVSVVFL